MGPLGGVANARNAFFFPQAGTTSSEKGLTASQAGSPLNVLGVLFLSESAYWAVASIS